MTTTKRETHRPAPNPMEPTVFHERWWLDAATEGTWRESVVETGGRIRGRLPYVPNRKVTGHLSLVMPRLTRCLGPAIDVPGRTDACLKQPTRHRIVEQLIEGLPRHSHLWIQMHRGIHDTLAFERSGCTTGVRYTSEIVPEACDRLWANMRDKTRNVIRRAQDAYVVTTIDADDFLAFYGEASRARGRHNDYDHRSCRTLLREASTRGRARCVATTTTDRNVVAAITTVEDEGAVYYLMSARMPHAHSGAVSLLLWDAIQYACGRGLLFDADGISHENQLLMTGLGGTIRPRLTVTRTTGLMAAGRAVKQVIAAMSHRS